MTPDLQDLLRRARKGDEAAFEALVVATRDGLFGVVRRLVGRDAVAEELLQEAYLALWKQGGPEPENPGAWLHRVCLNRALDVVRREEARRAVDPEADEVRETASDDPGPETRFLAAEAVEAVASAVDDLPSGERAAFVLRSFEGLEFEEIARRLGVRESTVRNQVASARRRLSRRLERRSGGA